MDWKFYIIKNKNATYAGVSPTPKRRLRQHNGEIVGGAKYTTRRGNGWKHVCIIEGFHDKIQAMQFEWAVKHASNPLSGCKKGGGGIKNRMKKLIYTLNKEKWTKKSPESSTVSLNIHWLYDTRIKDETNKKIDYVLPKHITESYENVEQQ